MNQGGTAKWLATLESGLIENGIETKIFAGKVQYDETEDERFAKSNTFHLKYLGKSISPCRDFRALIELRGLIKAYKPDVVNTHTSKAGTLGRIAVLTIIQNKPTIVHTYHGHLLYGYFKPWQVNLIVLTEKLLAKFTKFLIVSGTKIRNELLEVGIGDPGQYVAVKPGIVIPNFLNKSDARTKLGIKHDVVIVGWLGRITRIKRPDLVVELAKKNPELIFLMGGDGDLLNDIKGHSPGNLLTVGWSNPELIWGASDIAILTSDNEAQPISLVEAASAGLPLIAFDVGSINGVIVNNENGYLVTSIDEMSKAIKSLSVSRVERERLGEAGKHKIAEEFSIKNFINSHLDVYRKSVKNIPK